MTQGAGAPEHTGLHPCGCCGRQRPAGRLAELGQTPGVYICAPCSLWAARRAGPLSVLSQVPAAVRRLRSRVSRSRAGDDPGVEGTIPVLAGIDLDRTAAFFARVGFTPLERSEWYLVLVSGDAELHVARTDTAAAGQCLILVDDALALWNRLREHDTAGVGEIADQLYGLRDFTLSDPDGNRVRIGSPIPAG